MDTTKLQPYVGTTIKASTLDRSKIKLPKPLRTPSSKTFHQFPSLSFEIREFIWTATCTNASPRVVEIGFCQVTNPNLLGAISSDRHHGYVSWRDSRYHLPSKTVVPAVLHVCQQARIIGLKYYDVMRYTEDWTWTYIDWNKDYIYLNWSLELFQRVRMIPLWRTAPMQDLARQARHLVVNQEVQDDVVSWRWVNEQFCRAENVAVMCGSLRKAKLSSKNIVGDFRIGSDDDEGGFIELFDIGKVDSGLIATHIQFSSQHGTVDFVLEQQNPTDTWSNLPNHPCTRLVIGYLRKRRYISSNERESRDMMEDELYRSIKPLPPPHTAFQKTWTYAQIEAEVKLRDLKVKTDWSGKELKGWTWMKRYIKEDDRRVRHAQKRHNEEMEERLKRISYTCRYLPSTRRKASLKFIGAA